MATTRAVAAHRRAQVGERATTTDLTYDQIAARVGYIAATCHARCGNERTVEAVDELRALELERLDRLQEALWPTALEGDVRAVEAVVKR